MLVSRNLKIPKAVNDIELEVRLTNFFYFNNNKLTNGIETYERIITDIGKFYPLLSKIVQTKRVDRKSKVMVTRDMDIIEQVMTMNGVEDVGVDINENEYENENSDNNEVLYPDHVIRDILNGMDNLLNQL